MKLSALTSVAESLATKEVEYAAGWKLIIAPAGNKAYDEAVQKATRKALRTKRGFRRSNIDPETMERIQVHAASVGLVMGWSGLDAEDGSEMPYTPELAETIMTEHREVYKFVQEQSIVIMEDYEEALENASKN